MKRKKKKTASAVDFWFIVFKEKNFVAATYSKYAVIPIRKSYSVPRWIIIYFYLFIFFE